MKEQAHRLKGLMIKTVYKGEQSLRRFGPIVWDSMIPEKTKALSTFELKHFLHLKPLRRILTFGYVKTVHTGCAKTMSQT